MKLNICYLGEQYRQDDQRLLDVLGAIRANQVDESHFEHLEGRFVAPPTKRPVTKLYTHNAAVDAINNKELAKLSTEERTFQMTDKGNKKMVAALKSNCLAPEMLTLKVGAEVMFVANNYKQGYVNGTLGTVAGFDEDGLPQVQVGSRQLTPEMFMWEIMDGEKIIAEIHQLPLRLAWAITVHKSQGMSLDAAEIDLSKSFEPGMGYVALSRVRDLEGLYIKGINNTALMVNPVVTTLDKSLKAKSQQSRAGLKKIAKRDVGKHHERVRAALQSDEAKLLENYDKKLLKKLKSWRTKQARAQSAPSYVILSDKSLKLIAAIKPKNKKELAKVHGIGEQKLERYSKSILKILS